MHRILTLSLLLLPLLGCPSANDDDSADDGPVGEAPVLQSVEMCEVNNSRTTCGNNGTLQVAFDVSVTDVDGDLLNPQYFILLNEQVPWLDGRFEGDLGEGGFLRVTLGCTAFAPGAEIPWRFTMRDDEGNESDEFTGSYTVSVDPPGFGDPGVCPAL